MNQQLFDKIIEFRDDYSKRFFKVLNKIRLEISNIIISKSIDDIDKLWEILYYSGFEFLVDPLGIDDFRDLGIQVRSSSGIEFNISDQLEGFSKSLKCIDKIPLSVELNEVINSSLVDYLNLMDKYLHLDIISDRYNPECIGDMYLIVHTLFPKVSLSEVKSTSNIYRKSIGLTFITTNGSSTVGKYDIHLKDFKFIDLMSKLQDKEYIKSLMSLDSNYDIDIKFSFGK